MTMLRRRFLVLLSSIAPGICAGKNVTSIAQGSAPLRSQMDLTWAMVWKRFYLPSVQTFGDYLSNYEPGREQAHLPTAEEVKRQYPNPCGYSTGMEDGAILGGAMLSVLCDRYAVTCEDMLREKARQVFNGLKRCATVHGVKGFVARNVCPQDQTSIYVNSSRDQVTHFVHGLWRYYHSPLADDPAREEIRTLLAAVADRMIQYVVPETNYDFLRADGQPCGLGICRMWEVKAHEAARLPMIYAAAYDVTRDGKYHTEWRRYIDDAVSQSTSPSPQSPAYALLQMQCSLEVLHQLEINAKLKSSIHDIMLHVRDLVSQRQKSVAQKLAEKTPEQMRMLGPDWRTVKEWKNQNGYMNPQWGPFREIWHLTREAGESAVTMLMVDPATVPSANLDLLQNLIRDFDYEHNASCGLIYHLAAYWKWQASRMDHGA